MLTRFEEQRCRDYKKHLDALKSESGRKAAELAKLQSEQEAARRQALQKFCASNVPVTMARVVPVDIERDRIIRKIGGADYEQI